MAEKTESEQLEKRPVETPEPDPITDRSMSGLLLVSSLLLIVTLVWSLYDETIGQRPWREYQMAFVDAYRARLEKIKEGQKKAGEDKVGTQKQVEASTEYKELEQKVKEAEDEAGPKVREIDAQDGLFTLQLGDVTQPYQDLRAKIAAISYKLETSESESAKRSYRADIEATKKETRPVDFHADANKRERRVLSFTELEKIYLDLREKKAKLVPERLAATAAATEWRAKRDKYRQDNIIGLQSSTLDQLIQSNERFDFKIRQVNLISAGVVDRCESCHLGIRSQIPLTARDMGREKAFVSHPSPELLKTHDPDKFGCSSCHGGNGRATTSVEKGHGRYEHWLWPLYYKENVQAGCNQCHDRDRVTAGADVLNSGKDLFQNRGCVGCHRYEGFDRETDALTAARQTIKQLDLETDGYRREINRLKAENNDENTPDERVQRNLHRIDALNQTISQVESRIDQLDTQAKYLLQDQKKVGPNLKEIKLKLNRDWVPTWLRDPQAFRPATKMPNFRLNDDEIQAISAFLWQSAIDGPALAKQPSGDANHGKELFKSVGCLACHSIDGSAIGEGEGRVGGEFAADLSRVGEKANYDYIVRWVHNPRERTLPYCPTEKRDIIAADYAKRKAPFVFGSDHSKCPSCGHELQVQNMTVMPNFRLSDQDARDIATFLVGQKHSGGYYAGASFMDDTSLRDKGAKLVRNYGCAGCHEINGLEEEQRIGTELTKEGSKPIERLDFALLTHDAKNGLDPQTGKESDKPWYNHKGFFENKLKDPAVYDRGKEKAPEDRLRMPNIYLQDKDITSLTTFLLGSVDTSLPAAMRYLPTGQKRDVQDGWWIVKKYNCVGCHNVLPGQDSTLMGLPMYQDADGKEQLPPRLTTEGARVNPGWLLHFLKDPSLATDAELQALGLKTAAGSEGALSKQIGVNRNGVRPYLKAHMPTFNFSPNELQALVNFFMGGSSQPQPYIAEPLEQLPEEEQGLARALFTSSSAPCLKCHVNGDPAHDAKATAPNFLLARERLKPAWTRRWLHNPALISPGTSMPKLFKQEGDTGRWVFDGPTPPAFQTYDKDHADLLVKYMFQISPDEQRRLSAGVSSGGAAKPGAAASPPSTSGGMAKGKRRTGNLVGMAGRH